MTYRPRKQHAFMAIAVELSRLGTCDRKQVGAIIVRDGRCISWGYNGAPSGLPHCDYTAHGWKTPVLDELEELYPGFRNMRVQEDPHVEEMNLKYLHLTEQRIAEYGCKNATHAEANALAAAAKQGISTDGAELFVTVSPCETCARLIIAAGITCVYYLEEYRLEDGCQLLTLAHIKNLKLSHS